MTSGPPVTTALPSAARSASPRPSGSRIDVIDWLRGLAVVLMIQAHGYDAWLMPEAKAGPVYSLIRHASGLPSRLFLLLVGVSLAIRFESQLARGVPTSVMRAGAAKRGAEIVALAYLFRLQEWALSGFWGSWEILFRVDILNAIGASMLVVALVSTPRHGRRQIIASLIGAAFFLGLGPVIGPAHFPSWLPRALTSYLGGQRPMSWFALFPWGAWALVGVAVGHLWIRESELRAARPAVSSLGGVVGLAMTGAVVLVRKQWPTIISYPTDLHMQMGPGSFFFRLGMIGVLATVAWAVVRLHGARFSAMKQFGQTSLLIYWVHVDICYGYFTRPLQRKLGIGWATFWVVVLTLLMLLVSLGKTRHWARVSAWMRARLPALRRPPAAH